MARRDEELEQDVKDQLLWDARIDSSDIEVAVANGRVTLSGEVPAYVDRAAALDAALSVTGVTDVKNELTVRQPRTEQAATDQEIQERVSSVLAWNANIDKGTVHATVSDGIVTLEGTVNAHWKRLYVEDLVGSIAGVTWIRNFLAVAPAENFLDRIIAENVVAALERDPEVDAEQVEVSVKAGVVILSGYVPSWASRKSADKDASVTPGVSAVENHLGIRAA